MRRPKVLHRLGLEAAQPIVRVDLRRVLREPLGGKRIRPSDLREVENLVFHVRVLSQLAQHTSREGGSKYF